MLMNRNRAARVPAGSLRRRCGTRANSLPVGRFLEVAPQSNLLILMAVICNDRFYSVLKFLSTYRWSKVLMVFHLMTIAYAI